jgi:integrase
MPAKKRFKTNYPGVYYIESTIGQTSKPEKIYYITYRRDGKLIEEKAGRQHQDAMTPARAASLRTEKMEGKLKSNKERRAEEKAAEEANKSRWTIDKLWTEYKAQKPNLKGMVTDHNRYENHIKPILGDKEPKDLSPFDVDRLRIKLLKKKAPGTVKNVMELLRRIINFGIKKHLCGGLSFKIEMPRVNNLKTEDLSQEQLQKLIETIDKSKNVQAANIMRMVLFTGMRRGELFKLQWSDIDFERGFIRLKDPKGGPDQKIPLNDAAREVLQNHPKKKSPHVFPGRGGKQRTDIKKAVKKIKEDAGLPKDFRPLHGLRHVYASMLASSGQVDLYTLQKLLTHKSAQMTQRYAHLRDDALRRAADVAGELIQEAASVKGKGSERKG